MLLCIVVMMLSVTGIGAQILAKHVSCDNQGASTSGVPGEHLGRSVAAVAAPSGVQGSSYTHERVVAVGADDWSRDGTEIGRVLLFRQLAGTLTQFAQLSVPHDVFVNMSNAESARRSNVGSSVAVLDNTVVSMHHSGLGVVAARSLIVAAGAPSEILDSGAVYVWMPDPACMIERAIAGGTAAILGNSSSASMSNESPTLAWAYGGPASAIQDCEWQFRQRIDYTLPTDTATRYSQRLGVSISACEGTGLLAVGAIGGFNSHSSIHMYGWDHRSNAMRLMTSFREPTGASGRARYGTAISLDDSAFDDFGQGLHCDARSSTLAVGTQQGFAMLLAVDLPRIEQARLAVADGQVAGAPGPLESSRGPISTASAAGTALIRPSSAVHAAASGPDMKDEELGAAIPAAILARGSIRPISYIPYARGTEKAFSVALALLPASGCAVVGETGSSFNQTINQQQDAGSLHVFCGLHQALIDAHKALSIANLSPTAMRYETPVYAPQLIIQLPEQLASVGDSLGRAVVSAAGTSVLPQDIEAFGIGNGSFTPAEPSTNGMASDATGPSNDVGINGNDTTHESLDDDFVDGPPQTDDFVDGPPETDDAILNASRALNTSSPSPSPIKGKLSRKLSAVGLPQPLVADAHGLRRAGSSQRWHHRPDRGLPGGIELLFASAPGQGGIVEPMGDTDFGGIGNGIVAGIGFLTANGASSLTGSEWQPALAKIPAKSLTDSKPSWVSAGSASSSPIGGVVQPVVVNSTVWGIFRVEDVTVGPLTNVPLLALHEMPRVTTAARDSWMPPFWEESSGAPHTPRQSSKEALRAAAALGLVGVSELLGDASGQSLSGLHSAGMGTSLALPVGQSRETGWPCVIAGAETAVVGWEDGAAAGLGLSKEELLAAVPLRSGVTVNGSIQGLAHLFELEPVILDYSSTGADSSPFSSFSTSPSSTPSPNSAAATGVIGDGANGLIPGGCSAVVAPSSSPTPSVTSSPSSSSSPSSTPSPTASASGSPIPTTGLTPGAVSRVLQLRAEFELLPVPSRDHVDPAMLRVVRRAIAKSIGVEATRLLQQRPVGSPGGMGREDAAVEVVASISTDPTRHVWVWINRHSELDGEWYVAECGVAMSIGTPPSPTTEPQQRLLGRSAASTTETEASLATQLAADAIRTVLERRETAARVESAVVRAVEEQVPPGPSSPRVVVTMKDNSVSVSGGDDTGGSSPSPSPQPGPTVGGMTPEILIGVLLGGTVIGIIATVAARRGSNCLCGGSSSRGSGSGSASRRKPTDMPVPQAAGAVVLSGSIQRASVQGDLTSATHASSGKNTEVGADRPTGTGGQGVSWWMGRRAPAQPSTTSNDSPTRGTSDSDSRRGSAVSVAESDLSVPGVAGSVRGLLDSGHHASGRSGSAGMGSRASTEVTETMLVTSVHQQRRSFPGSSASVLPPMPPPMPPRPGVARSQTGSTDGQLQSNSAAPRSRVAPPQLHVRRKRTLVRRDAGGGRPEAASTEKPHRYG